MIRNKLWLSKLEKVNRESKICVVNYGHQFKIIGFVFYCQCFTLFVIFNLISLLKLLLLAAMFKFYSTESSIFSKIYTYKDHEIVSLNGAIHLTEQPILFLIKVFSKQLVFGKLRHEAFESFNFIKLDVWF